MYSVLLLPRAARVHTFFDVSVEVISAAQALVAVPPHAGETVRMTGFTALYFPSEEFFWTLIHTAAICGSSGIFTTYEI